MTLTPSMVYLAGIADPLRALLTVLTIVATASAIICLWVMANDNVPIKVVEKVAVRTTVCAVVFGLLTALTPSTKTIAAMYVLPAVVNSETVQKLPAEATGLALEWLKELRKERKK